MRSFKCSEELIKKLKISSANCSSCGKCMKNCSIINSTPKNTVESLDKDKTFDIDLAYSCSMCGLCFEVCPQNVDMGNCFLEIRKDFIKASGKSPSIKGYKTVKQHQKSSFSELFSASFRGDTIRTSQVFVPGCSLSSSHPDLVIKTYEYIKERLPSTGILLKCCGNPTELIGDSEQFNIYYDKFISEIKDMGAVEVITACPSCYKTITKNSPELKVISLWEKLLEIGLPRENFYRNKNLSFALHDPCPTRSNSNMQDAVRAIINYLGINIEEFEFSRQNTLCCGAGGMIELTNNTLSKNTMRNRVSQVNSDLIITYCSSCVDSIKKGGKGSIHLLELIFGDNPNLFDKGLRSTASKWINRFRCSRMIKGLTQKGISEKSKINLKAIAYVIFAALLVTIICFALKNNNFHSTNPKNIKEYLDSYGVLAPVIYIIMFTFVPLTLFPDSALAISSGLAFGLARGTLYTIIGALLGSTLSFFISRFLGRDAMKKMIKKDIPLLNWNLNDKGFLIILTLRLIPLFPFDLISYGAGLSKVKYREFILATLIGIIPGVYVYVNIGSNSAKPASLGFVFSIVLLILLIAFSYFLKKKLAKKNWIKSLNDND